jgi:hypothetical protein
VPVLQQSYIVIHTIKIPWCLWKESITDSGQVHAHFRVWSMSIIEARIVIVKRRTAITALSSALCLGIKFGSKSCSFIYHFWLGHTVSMICARYEAKLTYSCCLFCSRWYVVLYLVFYSRYWLYLVVLYLVFYSRYWLYLVVLYLVFYIVMILVLLQLILYQRLQNKQQL